MRHPLRCLLCLGLSALASFAQEPAEPTAHRDAERRPFVRYVARDDGGQLDLLVATYSKGDATVTLHAALYVADAEHYAELQQRFEAFDVLLHERIGDTELRPHPGMTRGGDDFLATFMLGSCKSLQLVQQSGHLDYRRDHFVPADITAGELFRALVSVSRSPHGDPTNSGPGEPDRETEAKLRRFDLVAAVRSGRGVHEMRVFVARLIASPDGQANEPTVIIEGRNEHCLAVLERQLAAGKKKIGIYYGAGHLEHMERRLVRDLGWKLVGEEWLVAWDCRANRFPVAEKGLQQKRYRARRDLEVLTVAVRAWTTTHPGEVPTWPALRRVQPDGRLPGRADGVDPWGRHYELRAKDRAWEVRCLGSDGVVDTEDDVIGEIVAATRAAGPARENLPDAKVIDPNEDGKRKALRELGQLFGTFLLPDPETTEQRAFGRAPSTRNEDSLTRSTQQTLQLQILALAVRDAAETYRRQHGRTPTLAELLEAQDAAARKRLQEGMDPWGRPLQIVGDASGAVTVRSDGPDGKQGTADDIVVSSSK